jgi:hypothetical protein
VNPDFDAVWEQRARLKAHLDECDDLCADPALPPYAKAAAQRERLRAAEALSRVERELARLEPRPEGKIGQLRRRYLERLSPEAMVRMGLIEEAIELGIMPRLDDAPTTEVVAELAEFVGPDYVRLPRSQWPPEAFPVEP